jgi:trimeric autotransporter adhesin
MDGFGAPRLGTTSYPVPSGARFVAPNGDDRAAGTQQAPWRTVAHAVAAAPSGATVVLRAGTYRESVEIPATKRLSLIAASGETVYLSGSDVVGGWVRQDSRTWRRPGWTHNINGGTLDPTLVEPGSPLAGDPDQLFVDGRRLSQVGSRTALGPGKFFVDEANDTLWMGEDPAGHTVEASVRGDGLTIKSSDTVVRGIGFRHFATPISRLGAVKVQGNHVTIEDSVFVHNAAAGLAVSGDDVRVVNVSATDNGQLGIQANTAHRLAIEDSLARRNNTERFSAIAASGGIKLTESDGVTLRHNLADENHGHGLWMDLSTDDARVVRNLARRNTAAGIIIEMSVRPTFVSNTAVENEVGIIVSETSTAQVWNNSLVDNGIAVHVLDGRRAPLPVDITIRNNVISSAVASPRPLVIVDDVNQLRSGAAMRVSIDRNAYFRKSTSSRPYLMAWANYPTNKFVFRTLADVQRGITQDRSSKILDNAADDPNIDDPAAGRYGLPLGSALAGAGLPLPSSVASIAGISLGRPVPIGIIPDSSLLG